MLQYHPFATGSSEMRDDTNDGGGGVRDDTRDEVLPGGVSKFFELLDVVGRV